ncbi:MAG: peptidylprolyl isomerase [Fibrobacter sp.]|nr:peptidylprolyl isomerase [Fibrobacter sp.]
MKGLIDRDSLKSNNRITGDDMNRTTVKDGDLIKIDYTVRLEDGTVMGSTLDNEPVEAIVGNGDLIPGLEKAVVGVVCGDSKSVKLVCDEAYGPRIDEMVQELDRCKLPEGFEPVIGQKLELAGDDDSLFATIIEISEEKIKIDANHLLAGKDIVVDFRIVDVK